MKQILKDGGFGSGNRKKSIWTFHCVSSLQTEKSIKKIKKFLVIFKFDIHL